jgi:hypothetical protein
MKADQAVDTAFWNQIRHTAPTGTSMAVMNVLQKALPHQAVSLRPEKSPQEQSVELLAQTGQVYRQLRDRARQQFETSGKLQVLLDFVDGEPFTLHDAWVRDVLVQRLHDWDEAAVKAIVRALKPKKPKLAGGATPQRARAYYRWVVARVSEMFLSGEVSTVRDAILRVALSSEGDDKRAEAGMPEAGDDRARQIYYQEIRRYAWRVMVMAGVGLTDASTPNARCEHASGKCPTPLQEDRTL